MTQSQEEYKRTRMAEIRRMVKAWIKNGIRVDLQLGRPDLASDDIARIMIAMQDMLDDSMDRHQRATDKVREIHQFIELFTVGVEGSLLRSSKYADSQATYIRHLEGMLQNSDEECVRLNQALSEANIDVNNTVMALDKAERRVETLTDALAISLEGTA